MIPDGKFRKKEHLLKSREFSKIYKKGISARSAGIIMCYLPNDLEYSRLGFSIGSRNIKLATSRNRIRRLFREAYRRNKSKIKIGVDIVLIVRKDTHDSLTYDTAELTFIKLANELRLGGK